MATTRAVLRVAGLCTVLATIQAGAALITIADPTTQVFSSSEIGGNFDRKDDYIVSNGLNGIGQHTNVVEPNMWLSTGTNFGGVDPDPWVIFDLGAVYTVNSFQVWNYNELAGTTDLTGRGVNGVTVEFGTSLAGATLGGSTGTVAGISSFARADSTATYTGEVFDSFTPFDARYIKFDINTNHGGDNNFYGLSEVQFDGVPVPEPGTSLLLTLAAGALLARLRRR